MAAAAAPDGPFGRAAKASQQADATRTEGVSSEGAPA